MTYFKKPELINLSDYAHLLTPSKKRIKNRFECPNCKKDKLEINPRNGLEFSCFGCGDRSAIRKAVLDLSGENRMSDADRDAAEAKRAEANRKAEEVEQIRISKLKTSDDRHADCQKIIDDPRNKLTEKARAEMKKRGWTDEWIEKSNARSVGYNGQNRTIFATDFSRRMVGGQQILAGSSKNWVGLPGTNQLRETGELPLTVVYPDKPVYGVVAHTESLLDKPWLTAQNLNVVAIGSSNVGSQPNDLKRSLAGIKERMGWDKLVVHLMPDAGMFDNKGVQSNYIRLCQQIIDLGYEIKIGYWNQYLKSDGDIDEIDSNRIKYIEFDRYLKRASDYRDYLLLTTLTGQTEIRNERYLSSLPELKYGEMTFVSSPVGTGKTTILESTIADWLVRHPNGKIVFIGHRNSLMNQMCDRLNINSYRVGYGQESAYINGEQKVAIVVDSLEQLLVDELPANVLVVIDESEGVLKHITLGGTTGNRTSRIQSHLTKVLNRVMVTGGHILGLEDSLTDLSIKGVKDLTSNKYKVNIIENQYEAFKYAVKMGGKNDFKYFISALVMRLKAGEKIALATTSQRFGEAVHKAIEEYVFGTKIERLDATTIEGLGELTKNPVDYLRAAECQLFIYSPTVESGFNIDDKGFSPLFDAMFAYFVNLDTRAHVQMLSRYRSNCPRYIYTNQKGAEQAALAGSPVKLDRMYQRIANQTSLEQGKGRIAMSSEGAIWNRLVAEFECRSHYSAQYLHEYLRVNLLERGHDVSVIDWQTETIELAAKYGVEIPDEGEIADRYGEIKIELLDRDANALFEADGRGITPVQSDSILHSSFSTNAQKIRAKKAKLHERLPGMEFSYEFIREAVIEDSGAYLRQCEFRYLIDKPYLAKELDRLTLESQSKESHLIYSRVPKNSQRVKLFAQMANRIFAIVDRGSYRNDSEDAIELRRFAIANWGDFWSLFGLTMREDMTVNTIVSKIFKKLGWQTERSQTDRRKKGNDTYLIINRDCQHAKDIEAALERRYVKVLEDMHAVSNKENLHVETACIEDISAISNGYSESIEDIAEGLRWIINHPEDYGSIRSTINPLDLLKASKLLSESEIIALRLIENSRLNRAA
jgi:hypothetical protein